MNTTIIFTITVTGHHVEYLHHVYELCRKYPSRRYVFLLPESFESKKHILEWLPQDNIIFDYIQNDVVDNICVQRQSWRMSYKIYKLLNIKVKQYSADKIWINSIDWIYPIVPLLMNRNVKMSGVLYELECYDDAPRSWKQRIYSFILSYIVKLCSSVKFVYVLNSQKATDYYNAKVNTDKYRYLSDPFMNPANTADDFRQQCGIAPDKTVFLHFGAMSSRKGTIEILESICKLPETEAKNYVFVFAGVVNEDIRKRFYALIEEVKQKCEIVLRDEFCPYEYINSACLACDAILIPYKSCHRSSGIFGYASFYKKPLVACNKGLIGEIVILYNLGYLITSCNSEELCKAYRLIANGNIELPNLFYFNENSISVFEHQIVNAIV